MLRSAFVHLSFFGKFILLISLVFSFLLFSSLLGILVLVPFYGTGVLGMLSSPDYANPSVVAALKGMQIVNMIGGILFPAVIYLWLCTPENMVFPGLNKRVSFVLFLLPILLIIFAQPFIGYASELNSSLSLPKWLSGAEAWMKNAETQGELITQAFLATTSVGGFMLNIFMIAVLPACAEEILFRGAVAGLIKDWTKNTHIAVLLSAIIFSAIHLQFYGFLPRFLLGVALGYMFFWSGSLWLPILAHFANNFLSVLVEFLFRKGYMHSNAENFSIGTGFFYISLSIVLVAVVLYFIRELSNPDKLK